MSRLVVAGVAKRLGRKKVLEGVDLTVDPGEIVAVLGANGAGKSTLLRIIAGVLTPDRGDVTLGGASLVLRPAARRALGYVPEAAEPLPHLTADELLALVAALKQVDRPPADLLARLGVVETLGQTIGAMSLGQRRRVCLAAALVGDPALLALDEPTNGLDPGGVDMLATLLAERRAAGRAALFATHDLDFASSIATRKVELVSGQLR